MKKFVLFFALIATMSFSALAQIASSVVVFSQEGEKFNVIVDGIRQNDTPQTNVKVTGLTAPNYLFKVIFEDQSLPSIDQNVMTRDVDNIPQDITYVIKKNNKGVYVMRVNSFAAATGNVTAEPNQYAAPIMVVNTNTGGAVQTQTVTTTVDQNVNANPNGASMNVSVVDPATGENVNLNMNVNMNVTGAQTQTSMTTTTVTTTTTTNVVDNGNVVVVDQPDHYVMQGYSGPIGCPWPMNESDFAAAQQTINSKSFESDKLTIAKQVLGSNCMTSDQVKWVMSTFSFEDSKLDFAKFAYGHVYDPGNYYRVNDAFTFSSSIDELNEYITGRH